MHAIDTDQWGATAVGQDWGCGMHDRCIEALCLGGLLESGVRTVYMQKDVYRAVKEGPLLI